MGGHTCLTVSVVSRFNRMVKAFCDHDDSVLYRLVVTNSYLEWIEANSEN